MKFRSIFAILLLSAASITSGCSNSDAVNNSPREFTDSFPKTREEKQLDKMGKIGGTGIFNALLNGTGFGRSGSNSGIQVNEYLWQAVMDVVYQMPIDRLEPDYGIMMTDWFNNPAYNNSRSKLNIYITSNQLSADAVKVAAFRQKRVGSKWVDAGADPEYAAAIEEKILYKARTLKVSSR